MGAINLKPPLCMAAAIVLAFVLSSAHAASNEVSDTILTGQNAKKIALIRLLARAGKNEEAAAGMRSLYPHQPPTGELAWEYYRIIGNTPSGWSEAKAGLEKLVKATPNDLRYRLSLAQHLALKPATRRAGIRSIAALAKTKQPSNNPDSKNPDNKNPENKNPDKPQILEAWRTALNALERSPDNIALYREYLAVDPGNTDIADALASEQRAEAKRQPWLLRDKADALLNEQRPEEAIATLKQALQLAPENPWVRFDLARLYHKRGLQDQGHALIADGLLIAPNDSDMLYACALYLGLRDEADEALRLLDKIPTAAKTPSMLRLQQKMGIQAQIQQAKMLMADGRRSEAMAVIKHAETDAGNDAELLGTVADAWLDIGETSRALALLKGMLAQSSTPSFELRLRYATLLNRMEHDEELAPLLIQLDSAPALSNTDQDDIRYLQTSLAARRADKLRHNGEYAAAVAVLTPALQRDQKNTDLLRALARVHIAAQQPDQARIIYQRILAQTPQDNAVRLSLAEVMREAGDPVAARQEIETVLANTTPADLDTRLSVAEWYLNVNDLAAARHLVDALRTTAPDNQRVLRLSGRIARAAGDNDEAMDYFKRAHADDEIARMQASRPSYILTSGMDYLSKSDGAPGISNLTLLELPLQMQMPYGYGGDRAFVQIDPVSADAGDLSQSSRYNRRQYGKTLALDPTVSSRAQTQSERGAALSVGYTSDDIRADIGTTPLGFPVTDVVGGIKISRTVAPYDYSFDVSRRPITSTLLAYAGAHDPVTGEVWGGVRSMGAKAHIGYDSGRFSAFADLGYYFITGKNVLNNTELALRSGFDYELMLREDTRWSAGLAFTNWRYQENLRFYTFGHGGYYSPQNYYSLAIPLRWTGRVGSWSYLLKGSVSASQSREKDMPFYPTDAALQAQGIANAATMTPYYTGGNGYGTGYSLSGALEKRFNQHLFIGARLTIDRSDYYTPNFAVLYLRYLFDEHRGKTPYPPDPVQPYSRY